MQPKHIIAVLALVLIGYFLGIKFPTFGSAAISKVTGAV